MQKKTDRKIRDGKDSNAKGKKAYVRPELMKQDELAEVTGGGAARTS